MRVLDHLLKSLRDAAVYNPEVQTAPACILWPDRDRQWEAVIPLLQTELPELLVLGDYAPDTRTGPAIWLRCVIAGTDGDVPMPGGLTPILYLPGAGRQDLRALESCPGHLKPLAVLQYRGVLWSQGNGKDWTILAWLKSDQGGLGLDVSQDSDAKNGMQLALYRFLEEDAALLAGKRLDKDYFNTLLTGGDPVRDLLQWLDQGDAFRRCREEQEWKAFIEVCKSHLAFDPQKEGVLTGCSRLANREGPWHAVWERYCEAPGRYPGIPQQIRTCKPPAFDLFADETNAGGWPQWNESREKDLHRELISLSSCPDHTARKKLINLEKEHGGRRSLVWAELGESPLACALEHLASLAEHAHSSLAAGSLEDLEGLYRSHGWKVDDAALRALGCVDSHVDLEAVTTALRSVYLPWIEESARYLQNLGVSPSPPGGNCLTQKPAQFGSGDCVLFVDGLRFDAARRLAASLEGAGFTVAEEPRWAALPSLTATGKPAVSPVQEKIRGLEENSDFEASVAETGQSLKGGYHLKKLLLDAGWTILEGSAPGDGEGMAWCECGDIDHEGHNRGWKLARHLDELILEIRDRIAALLAAGWKQVKVVTDHGWLLFPLGLPKTDLSSALTENKWGRCATLKPGAGSKEKLYPWYWNPDLFVALADGVSCYRHGQEYTHGGLSLQECLTLQLTVSAGVFGQIGGSAGFTDVLWKGLRCAVTVEGTFQDTTLDVRIQAGDPATSVITEPKPVKHDGTVSVLVEDEEREGQDAAVVLIDREGTLVAQTGTKIGGGSL